jgi:hypothetical protein
VTFTVNGLVYSLGSSTVICTSIWPKSWQLAPIRVDLAVRVIRFVEDHGHSPRLNDLKGRIREHIGAPGC